jgi:Cutinase
VNDVLKHIEQISKSCPEQKFVLAGHSQGAVVVTSSIPKIPQGSKAKLLAVTMFGAPPCLAEVKDKCKSYCNAGDDVSDLRGGNRVEESTNLGIVKICAGTTNPKASGLCNGPRGVKLWTGAPVDTRETTVLESVVDIQGEELNIKAAEECNADVPEKGHPVSGFAKSYNKDAFYTKAAACYIYKKFKSGTA